MDLQDFLILINVLQYAQLVYACSTFIYEIVEHLTPK